MYNPEYSTTSFSSVTRDASIGKLTNQSGDWLHIEQSEALQLVLVDATVQRSARADKNVRLGRKKKRSPHISIRSTVKD